jgi:hypothetical protein
MNMLSTAWTGAWLMSISSASESFPLQEKTMKATAEAVAIIFNNPEVLRECIISAYAL